MTRPFRYRRMAALSAAVLLLVGLIVWGWGARPSWHDAAPGTGGQRPVANSREPAADSQQSTADSRSLDSWGGALNSAREDGTGFFDRQAARAFAAAVPPDLRKYIVDLNARAFLPSPGEEAVAAVFPQEAAQPPAPRVAYLQFKDHPGDAEKRVLAAQGVQLLNYVTGYAWSARGTAAAFRAALSLDCVRAVARVDPRDKLHALVVRGQTPGYARAADGRTHFMLLAHPGTTPAGLARELAADDALVGLAPKPALPSVLGPRFEIPAAAALGRRLAALDSAAFLSLVPPPAASRGGTARTALWAAPRDATTDSQSNISAVRDAGPLLSGNGVRVGVREVGRMTPHVDFAARLTYVDNDGETAAVQASHATAVTGQVGSNGVAQPSAKGCAPAVSLYAYSLTGDTFSTADILDAATKGVRLSNHSYGPSLSPNDTFGDYESTSADWDAGLRSNDLVAVFAGNEEEGGHHGHIDYLVGAKNTICVSAASASAAAGNDNPLIPKADGIASFAEFGPMNDSRVKPDLVAFGDSVTLCLGTDATQTNSGTSFSTPAVTGVGALVVEHYKAALGREPSAAMLKAILCNSATDLGRSGPDEVYGFGILNAKEAVATIDRRDATGLTPFLEDIVANGGSRTVTINLASVTQLKATLCWMDVAGNPAAGKALVNDLDLELDAPDGTKYFPYSLNAAAWGNPATNSGPNTVDPIEQLVVDNPPDGAWTIRVSGTSIPAGPQAFAICLNCPAAPPPLMAVITTSGDVVSAQTPISFSSTSSSGVPSAYAWDFGDGAIAQEANPVHAYAAPGTYMVTLMLDSSAGAVHVVHITKRQVDAIREKARANLRFRGAEAALDDDFQFAIHTPDLQLPRKQASDALRNNTYLGKTFLIRIGGTADGASVTTKVAEAVLNARAQYSTKTVKLKLNPAKGQLQVQLRQLALESIFAGAGMTRSTASNGSHDMPVELETADTIYRAVFTLSYKVPASGKSGAAKTR